MLNLRDGLHLGLLVVILVGLSVGLYLTVRSAENRITEQSFVSSSVEVWRSIFKEIPSEMPGEYPDNEAYDDISGVDDISPEQAKTFVGNNTFLVTCALLVLLGCLGLAIQNLSTSIQEPWWNSFLRTGAILSAAFVSFFLWGFSLAFSYDHFGIFPMFSFYLPGSMDPIEYGLAGISEWADLFYIASYAAFLGCVVIGFSSAGMTTKSSFLVSIPILSFLFPIILSWKWGGGWIDALNNNSDFAGAALLHWHIGVVALLIGGVLTVYRKSKKFPSLPSPRPMLFLVGGFFYLVGIIGLNAGSTLSAAPDLVASVIQCTLLSGAASGVITSVTCLATRPKSLPKFLTVGVLAGTIGVSGGADGFNFNQSIIIGTLTGATVSGALVLFERFQWSDPLALGAIHGLGGFIGIFATCFSSFDEGFRATFAGQLILFTTVPILSLIVTGVVLLFAGAANLLVYEKKPKPVPPSLPGTP